MASQEKQRGQAQECKLTPKKQVKQATQNYIFRLLGTKEKKWSFSKCMAAAVIIIAAVISVFACVMVLVTQDLTPLEYLIPAIFGETAVVSAFYSHKAKAENELKIKMYQSLVNAELKRLDPDIEPIDCEEGEYDE